ncbi:hypothetical protein CBR_g17929 [Chara braunii]|uniref:Uncharacterized protein n=1 Tax=Chara braunii TaxID=69332 RepID=A0A388KVY1_CHABU|nr:hypothetical protein CBR_g17929 [Chara braunii]|eukprot:GBG74216.1 hypothetical protein CBR_g17929 [Chara braunii]
MKAWYDAEMEKLNAQRAEAEPEKREREEEEKTVKDKKDREDFHAELNATMNAKMDRMYEAMAGRKLTDSNDAITALKKEVENLRLRASGSGAAVNNCGNTSISNDELIARLLQEHEQMKVKMGQAADTSRRVQMMEDEIKALRSKHDEAIAEVETWKKEALRPGIKRSCTAMTPDPKLRSQPLTTPMKSAVKPAGDPAELVQLHRLEVNSLKELRLQELNQ